MDAKLAVIPTASQAAHLGQLGHSQEASSFSEVTQKETVLKTPSLPSGRETDVAYSPAKVMTERIRQHFGEILGRPLAGTMAEIVGSLLLLAGSSRGWYGRLTLHGIARCMATPGEIDSRYKRLDRFLCNSRLVIHKALQGLLTFSGGMQGNGLLPVLLDQTALNHDQVQALVASFPWGNRGIPFAMTAFEYGPLFQSQNMIEGLFLDRILEWAKGCLALVFIMDRGYAKLVHLKRLVERQALFIVRGRSDVLVEYHGHDGWRRIGLGRLPHRQGIPLRYRNVLYHGTQSLRVDIVVYRGRGFQEPWFLIVPPDSEASLPTEQVVEYYRWRMRIEVTFRDFKSCLGLRGLRLKVRKAEKMERLLICLALAYIVLVAMGETSQGRALRKRIEIRRKKPRHGTRRTLSVLTIALFIVGGWFAIALDHAMAILADLMKNWTAGVFSPYLANSAS